MENRVGLTAVISMGLLLWQVERIEKKLEFLTEEGVSTNTECVSLQVSSSCTGACLR